MRKNSIIKLLLLLLLLQLTEACRHNLKIANGLRKLSTNEVISMIKKNEPVPQDIKIISEDGKPIDNNIMLKVGQEKLVTDFYADSKNKVKLLVVRAYNDNDKQLFSEIKKANNEAMLSKPLDVDCNKISEILSDVRLKDQQSRTTNGGINTNYDRENQRIVFSIINKCGFPTAPINDSAGLETIFLVIQHGTKEMRAKYLPYFIKLSKNGEFSESMVALMEDRVLMDSGKKQKYGSQLQKVQGGAWELYPVDNIDSVNARRKSIGLNTLEDYLKEFRNQN